jgi:hypothetical protein
MVEPALPYLLICYGFICLDCYSAYELSKRVKAKYQDKAGEACGKFRSDKLGHVFSTIAQVTAVVLLVYFAQKYIFADMPFNVCKIVAGAVCGWQFWSFLENKASCNGAKWASKAKKILVDKTNRHFDVQLSPDDILADDED